MIILLISVILPQGTCKTNRDEQKGAGGGRGWLRGGLNIGSVERAYFLNETNHTNGQSQKNI